MTDQDYSVVLFDGVCNLCNGAVDFLIERDPQQKFRFASLQSETGERLLAQHGVDPIETDSIVLIENGAAFTHSTAALRIGRTLGGIYGLGYVLIVIPKFLRDPVYKFIARNRYKWFGKRETCRMPTEDDRKRFI